MTTRDHTTDFRLVENLNEGVLTSDVNGIILAANPALERMFGYESGELVGQNIKNLMPLSSARVHDQFVSNFLKTGESKIVGTGRDLKGKMKNGKLIDVYISVSETLNDDGEIRYIAFLYDNTKEKAVRREIEEQRSFFKSILDSIPDALIISDINRKIVMSNPALQEVFGYDMDEVEGKSTKLFYADSNDFKDLGKRIFNVSSQIQNLIKNIEFKSKNNRVFTGETIASTLRNDEGKIIGYVAVIRDITDRLIAVNKLNQAKEEAEKANNAKSEFISSMSHELRTPLNAILGFSQLLSISSINPLNDKQRKQVEHITKAGNHLLGLVDEVLDLAKIEAGHMDMLVENTCLCELVRECCMLSENHAEKFNITIHNGLEENDFMVQADLKRAKQVILNLMSNAIKYNQPSGHVWISAEEIDDAFIRLNVKDSGKGIEEEFQQFVFQPFSRLGKETSQVEGTGIGLMVTKRLIEEMGGKIGFDSQYGIGTTFWLDFPKSQVEGLHCPVKVSLKTYNMLLIEDNQSNVTLISDFMANYEECSLSVCSHVQEGLRLMESHIPDIVMLDLDVSGSQGLDWIRKIKAKTHTAKTHIIVLGTEENMIETEKLKSLGVDHYLKKPLRLSRLMEIMNAMFFVDQ